MGKADFHKKEHARSVKKRNSRKSRATTYKSYRRANISRILGTNNATTKKWLTNRMSKVVGKLTRKLGKKSPTKLSAVKPRKLRKYKREKLGALIAFLKRIDELDDMALETDNDDLRIKLSIFIVAVMGELEEPFETIKTMLPSEHDMGSDIDDLIGAISGMSVENHEGMEDIIGDATDILEKLRDEYQDEDIMEEAREIYGFAIDLLVERFIAAIQKHKGELAEVPAAAAGNNISDLMKLFYGLGL